MKIKPLKSIALCILLFCICASNAKADIRITTRYSQEEQSSETAKRTKEPTSQTTVTYIKGSRQRNEPYGMRGPHGKPVNTASIFQCDLKRLVWLDNTKKEYGIYVFGFRNNEEASAYYNEQAVQPNSPYARRLQEMQTQQKQVSAIINATTTLIDTGERREMFGYTARHIKTVTVFEVEPKKACSLSKSSVVTDGWYIDLLYSLDCSSDISGQRNVSAMPLGRCGDRVVKEEYLLNHKTIGSARLGFPLILIEKTRDESGRIWTNKTEVTELLTEELDASLFEVPVGYKQIELKQTKK